MAPPVIARPTGSQPNIVRGRYESTPSHEAEELWWDPKAWWMIVGAFGSGCAALTCVRKLPSLPRENRKSKGRPF